MPETAMQVSANHQHQHGASKLRLLLEEDLDFHDQESSYASHTIHAFPAKFPPQLPRKFIEALTLPGDAVLDPMMGSGTTVLEAFLLGRKGIGFDIDPLAVLLTKTKVSPISYGDAQRLGKQIVYRARKVFLDEREVLEAKLEQMWDNETKQFVDYWFSRNVQLALMALIGEIDAIDDERLRDFFKVVFSSIIITKSGGVSLALDLAHTRPHRVNAAVDWNGRLIAINAPGGNSRRTMTKRIRCPFDEFEKKCLQSLRSMAADGLNSDQLSMRCLFEGCERSIEPYVSSGDARYLLLDDECVDLIITSPPYASNAIDYMRAHKFSLVWLGHSIGELRERRKGYLGGETINGWEGDELPEGVSQAIDCLARYDRKKSVALRKYCVEMKAVLREMFRVLKRGRAAIVVVGDSKMRDRNIEIHAFLREIGESVGFSVPNIGIRRLDRNRRMMPAGVDIDHNSQIQRRMHEEYVIGFYKPLSGRGINEDL